MNVKLLRMKHKVVLGMSGMLLMTALTVGSVVAQEYEASDVDSAPKVVKQMPVTFPAAAKQDGITGRVIIRCLIGVNGKADKMEINESEPTGIFDESALSSLKNWQFRPGIKGGKLVATWVKIPFKFE